MATEEFSEKFIRRVGSRFALAQFHCELIQTLKVLSEAKSTANVVRCQLLGNEAIKRYHNTELNGMFHLRFEALEIQIAAIVEAVSQCYRLNVPGDSPGTQEQLLSLGYFEYTIEEAEGDLRRGAVREGCTT